MTTEQINALRKIYDKKHFGYNLYINGTNDMFPSKSQESILAYDDKNEIVHCIRRSADPYRTSGTANIATTTYDQIIKIEMNIDPSELKGILDLLVADGQITAEVADNFIKRMSHSWKNPQKAQLDVGSLK